MSFFGRLFPEKKQEVDDYFARAARVYALKGDQIARWAALAAANRAGKKGRSGMVRFLPSLMSEMLKDIPDKNAKEATAGRLFSLIEEIQLREWKKGTALEEEKKLWENNPEYLEALKRGDAAIFAEKYPDLF
jgi:hypothetical protein